MGTRNPKERKISPISPGEEQEEMDMEAGTLNHLQRSTLSPCAKCEKMEVELRQKLRDTARIGDAMGLTHLIASGADINLYDKVW